LEELCVLDIGGGVGIMSMMLKAIGVGEVCYLDRNAVVAKDAKKLSGQVGMSIDQVLVADISSIDLNVRSRIDLAISRDVLEHIYDLSSLSFQGESWPNLRRMVHNTSANMYCIWLKKYFRKVHQESEKEGVMSKNGSYGGYWFDRYRIIENLNPDLDSAQKAELATHTKGLDHQDVIKYMESNVRPKEVIVQSNTCDPRNGNWAERLLPLDFYREWATLSEFDLNFTGGFVNEWKESKLKNAIFSVLNVLIKNEIVGPSLWPSLTMVMDRFEGAS